MGDDLEAVCGHIGVVLVDDDSDHTSKVKVQNETLKMTFWVPTGALEDLARHVEIASLSIVKAAVEAHASLKWDPRYEKCAGKPGKVMLEDESDGTSKVVVEGVLTGWFPASVLTTVGDYGEVEAGTGTAAEGSEAAQNSAAKRPRTE